MAYDKFNILTSSAATTNRKRRYRLIIPASLLKVPQRGFKIIFRELRYNGDDTPKADFVLNDPYST
jgi:3-isopropylmalate/(R)-2-methylmalate dehydratase small subunit